LPAHARTSAAVPVVRRDMRVGAERCFPRFQEAAMPDVRTTTCAIAGGGPARIMLGLLLARAGARTTVLEKHGDFLRDFPRPVLPSTRRLMDELGLVRERERVPHQKLTTLRIGTRTRPLVEADLTRFRRWKYRHIAMIPQWDFLTLLADHAQRYPTFRLLMEA